MNRQEVILCFAIAGILAVAVASAIYFSRP
jgi:hypothetical protein